MSAVIDVTSQTFQQQVIQQSHQRPVVVDFWAPWCGPCRMLGPVLERLAQEPNSGFVLAKLNVDYAQQLAMQYGIQGIPAVKAFVNGRVVNEFVGVRPEPFLREFVQKLPRPQTITPPSDDTISQAQQFLRQGHGRQAEAILQKLPPAESEKWLPLAQFLSRLEQGQGWGTAAWQNQYQQVERELKQRHADTALYLLLALINQENQVYQPQLRQIMAAVIELWGPEMATVQAYRAYL